MAVSGALLVTNSSTTDTTSYTTASITPTANALILCAVASEVNDSADAEIPTITGNGLTWVQVATTPYDQTGVQRGTISLFRSMGASPSAGAVTIDFSGNTQVNCLWAINEFTGVDTSGTNGSGAVVQSATNKGSSTTLTVTLGAFGSANNATFGAFVHQVNEAHTAGSGFTALSDKGIATPGADLSTQWRVDNDTSVDASWTTAAAMGGIAVEIAQSTGSTLSVSVSDSVTITESIKLLLESQVAVNDTATTSENIGATLVHNVGVSDSVTASESTKTELNSNIVVSDSVTLTENSSLLIPTLFITQSDSVTITESIASPNLSYGVAVTPGPAYTVNGVKVV